MEHLTALRVIRVRMWEMGHSFEEIDDMSLSDVGDVLGYWGENSRADATLNRQRKNLKKGKK